MILHRKLRLIQTESHSHEAFLLVLISEKLVNRHIYNKTYWIPSDDYLEIVFQWNYIFFMKEF
jgi:hypothetical protein